MVSRTEWVILLVLDDYDIEGNDIFVTMIVVVVDVMLSLCSVPVRVRMQNTCLCGEMYKRWVFQCMCNTDQITVDPAPSFRMCCYDVRCWKLQGRRAFLGFILRKCSFILLK
jgi:hypothetical protein